MFAALLVLFGGAAVAQTWVRLHSPLDGSFRVFYREADFFEAQRNCWAHGFHLASFNSVEEFRRMSALADRTDAWIGLYHLGERLPSFPLYRLYFTDGSPYNFTTQEEHEALWGKYATRSGMAVIVSSEELASGGGEFAYDPNNDPPHAPNENCAYISFDNPFYVNGDRMNDNPCTMKKPAHICRKVVDGLGWDRGLPFETAEQFYRMQDDVLRTINKEPSNNTSSSTSEKIVSYQEGNSTNSTNSREHVIESLDQSSGKGDEEDISLI